MVFAEFALIAFAVGIATQSWLVFLGTFCGLAAVYRMTPLAALLSLVLSLYWGLLGYWLGASTGEPSVAPLAAVVGFLGGAYVHRRGFTAPRAFLRRIRRRGSSPFDEAVGSREAPPRARRSAHWDDAEVIDVQYTVLP